MEQPVDEVQSHFTGWAENDVISLMKKLIAYQCNWSSELLNLLRLGIGGGRTYKLGGLTGNDYAVGDDWGETRIKYTIFKRRGRDGGSCNYIRRCQVAGENALLPDRQNVGARQESTPESHGPSLG